MGELGGSMTTPMSATWTCKHGVHLVMDFGEFQAESPALFKTEQEAQATAELMMQGINELFAKLPAPGMPEATYCLETLAMLFAHMTTPQATGKGN